jgi:hypothetical protein
MTTHNIHNRQTSMPPGGIGAHNLSRRAAKDLRLRPRGQWDWPSNIDTNFCNKKRGFGLKPTVFMVQALCHLFPFISDPALFFFHVFE